MSYYDDWYDYRDARVYKGDYIFDLQVSRTIGESVTLTLGAQNLFDNKPDENPNASSVGNRYSAYTPFSYSGSFLFLLFAYDWQ